MECRKAFDIAESESAKLSKSDRIHLSKMVRFESAQALRRHFEQAGDLSTRADEAPPPLYISIFADRGANRG